MDDRWDAYVEADQLFLHRSWTGLGIYEAQFAEADGGWRICEAVVAGDGTTYRREDAERDRCGSCGPSRGYCSVAGTTTFGSGSSSPPLLPVPLASSIASY
jgi:hypothetical protein